MTFDPNVMGYNFGPIFGLALLVIIALVFFYHLYTRRR